MTYKFLCSLLYCGDNSRHSTNVPDEIGFTFLITSDCDLREIKPYMFKQYYQIVDYMEQNDCEAYKLELIEDDEFKELQDDNMEIITINRKDVI